jgi:hypothetical protein
MCSTLQYNYWSMLSLLVGNISSAYTCNCLKTLRGGHASCSDWHTALQTIYLLLYFARSDGKRELPAAVGQSTYINWQKLEATHITIQGKATFKKCVVSLQLRHCKQCPLSWFTLFLRSTQFVVMAPSHKLENRSVLFCNDYTSWDAPLLFC